MKSDALRNFTVRFLQSALERIETTAKPFYGGRLSTGEAIRRLAEERLDEIEGGEGAEETREALLRLVSDWRSARIPSIGDLRFLAWSAAEAYRRCTAEFVSRDLLIANVSAFRDAVKQCTRGAGTARSLTGRYALPGRDVCAIDGDQLLTSIERWIAKLPARVTPAQAKRASQDLAAFLREERWPDDGLLGKALRVHVSSLLELSIRAYWRQSHRPLIGPEADATRERPRDLAPLRHGSITLKAAVRNCELWVAIELPSCSAMMTNDVVEMEDLSHVIRLALERDDGLGEVFSCSREPGEPTQFRLSTECCRWTLEATEVVSIAEALDALSREPAIAALLESARFVYGRI
jgi:hypothetical protein